LPWLRIDAMHGELAVRGGMVVDGTGSPARRADVLVRSDRVIAVGAELPADCPETGVPGCPQVSTQYGDPSIWPGDTFGISVFPDWNGGDLPEHVALSWGSAVGGSQNSEIYAAVVGR
jgi:hypothetical protein